MDWLLKQKEAKEAKIAEYESRIAEVTAKEEALEAEIAAKKAELEEEKAKIACEENIEQTKAELAEINSILEKMNGAPKAEVVAEEIADAGEAIEEPVIVEVEEEVKAVEEDKAEEPIPCVEKVEEPVEEKIEEKVERPLFNPRDLLR